MRFQMEPLFLVNIPPRLPRARPKRPRVSAPAASGDFQPPNERVSPQGSVEAQCGLVLNGQGGVIRRGKALVCLPSLPAPEAANTRRHDTTRHDTTRHDSELQADKQAQRSSVVCCQRRTNGHAGAHLLLLKVTVTHALVTPRVFFLSFFFFLLEN